MPKSDHVLTKTHKTTDTAYEDAGSCSEPYCSKFTAHLSYFALLRRDSYCLVSIMKILYFTIIR